MSLWGSTDNAANSVNYATELTSSGPQGSGNAAKAANNTALYGNTTPGAFNPGAVKGQFAVNDVEMANTSGESKKVTHTGWQMRTEGTGPVTTLAVSVGGTGYSNTDLVKVSGGTTNAAGTLSTNSSGGISTVVLTVPGAGFKNLANSTIAVTNSTGGSSAGSGATLTFTLGGRAGRVHYETIVAMGISSNGTSDDGVLPQ